MKKTNTIIITSLPPSSLRDLPIIKEPIEDIVHLVVDVVYIEEGVISSPVAQCHVCSQKNNK
jgi:hypothetical protein